MSASQVIKQEVNEHENINKKALLFSLCFVLMFSVMNGTMFNIAIPDIAEAFQLSASEVSWVMTGYIMVYSIGTLIYGKLADSIALKKLITFGLIVFSAGSVIGFFAPNYLFVLLARVIQAIGGSMIPAVALISPIRYFRNERGRVLGIISSVMAFASGIGPILGGTIAGFLDWQYLFLSSALIIITLPLLRKNLPDEEPKMFKLDYFGASLVAAFIVTTLMGITLGIGLALILSVLLFIAVILRMKTAKTPFIPPHLFKNRNYLAAIMTSFVAVFCLFGLMFSVPIMLRDVYNLTTMQIGLTMFPGAMSAALIGKKGGDLVDFIGSKKVFIYSLTFLSFGLLIVSSTVGVHPIYLCIALIFPMLCFPLVQASGADMLANILHDSETGVGMGVFNLLNFVSGAMSGAIVGKMIDLFSPKHPLNPLAKSGDGNIFSNVFLLFMFFVIIGVFIFRKIYKGER
ncbi:MFS transporter [Bacillaceae bacterium W0354]